MDSSGFIYKKNRQPAKEEKGIRTIFARHHGLEIFKAKICNSRQQCESLKVEIVNPREALLSELYDRKGYVPTLVRRLKLKNPAPWGHQSYSVEINPDFIEKIIPYYDFDIAIRLGDLSNSGLKSYVDFWSGFLGRYIVETFPILPFSLAALLAVFALFIWVMYQLLKPKKGDRR